MFSASYRGMSAAGYFAHPTACVDTGATIGTSTKVWHFSRVSRGAVIGRDCVIGQGCYIGDVKIGDRVTIQNHVSVYEGVVLEDDVFCGASCVFTNVINPRSGDTRTFESTLVRRGATIGANATIVCGAEIGAHAFVGAGAVVRDSVPSHGLVVGVPALQIGWMCICGERLKDPPEHGALGFRTPCAECGREFLIREKGAELLEPMRSPESGRQL